MLDKLNDLYVNALDSLDDFRWNALNSVGYFTSRATKEVVDQLAHFMLAILILLPAFTIGGVFGFALTGAGIGMVREVTERDGLNPASTLDVLFWSLGGLAAGLLFA